MKRRKREIGVYNILGMGKRHIARMLFTETLITAVIGIGAGLVAGLVFSKLMYLALFKLLHFDVGLEFSVSVPSLMDTLVLFLVIFLLTLIYNLMQIRLANPVELLQGSRQGEREPKTKILLAIIGFALIGAGYTIALITESPLEAISCIGNDLPYEAECSGTCQYLYSEHHGAGHDFNHVVLVCRNG